MTDTFVKTARPADNLLGEAASLRWLADAEQPALVRQAGHAVSRNHDDLWGGNVLYDGGATGVTLIDPYGQGGHAETDLESLAVFGLSLREDVVAAYDDVSPLADGWEARVGLHELAMVIMHAYKYGGVHGGVVGVGPQIRVRAGRCSVQPRSLTAG